MISNFYKGNTLMEIVVVLSFLSVMLLTGQRWLNQQQQQTAKLWQYAQALQIAENQQTLQLLEQSCQSQVTQNKVTFLIRCEADMIIVEYPLGQVKIYG